MAERPYHHGDLRRALLEGAVGMIAEKGPTGWSMRELARKTGVSHAAPAHHFGDKTGVLTAVAAEGFRRQTESLRGAAETTGSFLEVGVAYVRFAVDNPSHFEVMYRPDLVHTDAPELVAARRESRDQLYPGASRTAGVEESDLSAGLAAWSLVHGLATLWLNGALPPEIGEDLEETTRRLAGHLFIGR